MFKKKSPLKSTRLVERKKRMVFARLLLYISLVLCLIVGVSWLSDQEEYKLTLVEVSGNAGIDSSSIEEVVNNNLAGAYAYFFSRANRYIYPQEKITEDIMQAFPAVETVGVDASGETVEVIITERKPSYIWCRGVPEDLGGKGCYFMDKKGFIFSEAPDFSGPAFFAYYGLVDGENPIRQTYMPEDQFALAGELRSLLEAGGIPTVALVASDGGLRELHLAKGGKIMFKNSQDSEALIRSLDIIKKETPLLESKDKKLDYIDMRFGSKVYYSFVGDNRVQTHE